VSSFDVTNGDALVIIASLTKSLQELRERTRAELAAAESRYHENVESLRASHESKVSQLMDRHATVTENMNKAHSDRMADMITAQTEERKATMANHAREMETLRQLHASRCDEFGSRIKTLESELSSSADKLLRAMEKMDELNSTCKNLEFQVSERNKTVKKLEDDIMEFRRLHEISVSEWGQERLEMQNTLKERDGRYVERFWLL
jgi:chromosome segregation ATPase